MKIVFDTNVLLAALFTRGLCESLLDHCLANDLHALFVSEHILSEFAEHAGKFRAAPAEIREALDLLRAYFHVVQPLPVPADACRDIDDLPVLGTLLAAQADCLVTGDKDLLVLKQYQKAPILSPRELHNLLRPVDGG